MKKTAPLAALCLVVLTGCATAPRPAAIAVSAPDARPDASFVRIGPPPEPSIIAGGVLAPGTYVSPDDPFVTSYVRRRPVGSDYADIRMAPGAWLGNEVRLLPVPGTPYAYGRVNGVTVLADPNRRRIIKLFS